MCCLQQLKCASAAIAELVHGHRTKRHRGNKTQGFRDDRQDFRRPSAGSPVAFGVHATAIGMGRIYLGISADFRHALRLSPGQWNDQGRAKPWPSGESWHAAIFAPCHPMAYQLPRLAMRLAKHSHAAEAPCKTRGPSHAQQPPLPRRDHADPGSSQCDLGYCCSARVAAYPPNQPAAPPFRGQPPERSSLRFGGTANPRQ